MFDTQSYYNIIRGVVASSFLWKGVWKDKIPRRVAFCVDSGSWADPYIG